MGNFVILLPLIIGDKVPEENPLWECFLLLVEITRVCTAKKIPYGNVFCYWLKLQEFVRLESYLVN